MNNGFKKALSGATAVAVLSAVGVASAPLAFAATGGNSNSSNTTTTQSQPLLVALGDSITFGYNLPDTNGNTVPSASAFPISIGQADHMRVSDLGIPGWTSTDLLNALQSPDFERAIQAANVVSIDIGSNDLLHLAGPLITQAKANPTAPLQISSQQEAAFKDAITAFGGNITKIVTAVRQLTNAPILLYNMYDPFPVGTGLNTVTEQLEAGENALIAQVAASTPNVTVVDAHKAFATHELAYVRVAQNDVHPTVVGQGVLAQIGETALLPNLPTIAKAKVSPLGSTSLLATSLPGTGGSVSGTLSKSKVTVSIPTGALNHGTEVAVTSQPANTLLSLATSHTQVVSEVGVNFMAGVKLASPYQLTVTNPAIVSSAAVYQVGTNGSLVAVPSAKVTTGKAVIPATKAGDFVILTPKQAAVTGVTKPVTGLPIVEEGALSLALIIAGAGLVWLARRRRGEA